MKIEIDGDAIAEVATQALLSGLDDMKRAIERYNNDGWFPIFSLDKEEDLHEVKKLRACLSYVLANWFGVDNPLTEYKSEVRLVNDTNEKDKQYVSGTGTVELIKENPDGSADYQFDMPPEALAAMTRLGILTALKAGIADAQKLDPKFDPAFTDEIRELAEEAGFVTWQGERWNVDNNVVDWANQYDKELVKFYHLVKENT